MVLVLVRDTYTLKHDLYGSHIIAYIMSDRFSEKLLVTQTDKELILLTYNFVAFLGLIGVYQSIHFRHCNTLSGICNTCKVP